jgi:two-component system sensor histidine kinase KdpD
MAYFSPRKLIRFGVPLAAVLLITAITESVHTRVNPTTIALIFLLVILFSASFFGRNPALLASLAAMLSFNYYFLPPYGTWHIADSTNWVAWIAFILTAVTAGELSAYARRRADEATRGRLEIERLYNELQDAFEQASQTEALRQSEKLKSSLLDAVTHDLRTPLTSIKASVTTLLEDRKEKFLDEEGQAEFLEIINEETDRLNEFIESMVGLAKIEANALHIRKSWSEVEEIINNAVERAKNQLSSNQILIEIERDLPNIFVDASSIAEVVYTLLDNAAKYSPENSRIRISARRAENETVEITVEDEGKGIEEKMREKVFEKFVRAETEDIHTTASGLGLGLAIAHGIVESQGGRIWIENGSGDFMTKFVFQIPIGDDENNFEVRGEQPRKNTR